MSEEIQNENINSQNDELEEVTPTPEEEQNTESEEQFDDEPTYDELAQKVKDLEEKARKAKELEDKNKQLYARAKKAEDNKNNPSSPDTFEVADFIAKGHTREDYEQVQKIMKATGQSLSEAMSDPLFEAYAEKRKRENDIEKAQIGNSTKQGKKEEAVIKPGMSRKEYLEAMKKKFG